MCAVHTVDNYKLWMNFELIVLQVQLDVFQNPKVVIIKKEGGTIPCKIIVRKSKNGDNIIVNFCTLLGDSWDKVKHMWNKQISWDFNNDEVHFVL